MSPARRTASTAVARKRGSRHGRLKPLHHAHFHAAPGRPLDPDVVHEAAHEEDAASARLQEVLGRERIGQRVGVEPVAVVPDADRAARSVPSPGVMVKSTSTSFVGSWRLPCLMALMTDSRTATPTQCWASSSSPSMRPSWSHQRLDEIDHLEQARELEVNGVTCVGHAESDSVPGNDGFAQSNTAAEHGPARIAGDAIVRPWSRQVPWSSRPSRAIIGGRLRVPGDKSIAHRYALLAALAAGRSVIRGFAPGADCRSTLACLEGLGVGRFRARDDIGHCYRTWSRRDSVPRPAPLDAGNSGTTTRLLAGLARRPPFSTTLTGDDSLPRRPMRRVIEPLSRMGARIDVRRRAPADDHPRAARSTRSTT